MQRRRLLQCLALPPLCTLVPTRLLAAPPDFPRVLPRPLVFPRDHGAHPDFRTEWWYVTGWLDAGGQRAGFQVTFFRSRTTHDPANPSRFAPHQLVFAHAALASEAEGKIRHDQRAARVVRGVRGDAGTSFSEHDTDVVLEGWRLQRLMDSRYRTEIDSETLKLELTLAPTQPLLLQGEGGFSRKGVQAEQASYYYSQPQLAVSGRINFGNDSGNAWQPASGKAWLDHEWSSRVLDDSAAGWDWVGINLDDGAALMAFRIRPRVGDVTLWATARLRSADGRERSFGADEVRFEPLATWRSPQTGTVYPVRSRLILGRGAQAVQYEIEPLLEDQELDTRRTTGAVYWEGAVTLRADGQRRGQGYLELVGYHRPMSL